MICRKTLYILMFVLLPSGLMANDGLDRADSLYRAGKYKAAVQLLENGVVPELEAEKDTISLLKAWSILGCCHVETGDHETAAKYCNMTIPSLDYYGVDYYFVTNTLFSIGQMYHRLGYNEEALQYIDRSLIYETELGRPNIITRRYIEKASILMDLGEYTDALEVLENGLPYTSDALNPHYRSQIIYYKGLCYEKLGDDAAADEMFRLSEQTAHFISPKKEHADYTLVPGLLLKMGDYAIADRDTAKAVSMYNYAVKNAKNVHEYDTESKALTALSEIYRESDREISDSYMARADSLTFAPYIRELALKMSLAGIEFPLRESEHKVEMQRMRILALSLALMLLFIIAFLLWYKIRVSRQNAEHEREKLDMLERELEQKRRLLVLADTAHDQSMSQEVRDIANELGDHTALTKRESEICTMIKQGLINKEIADRLNISLRTVQNHRSSIYRKLGVTNTAELINAFDKIPSDKQE